METIETPYGPVTKQGVPITLFNAARQMVIGKNGKPDMRVAANKTAVPAYEQICEIMRRKAQ